MLVRVLGWCNLEQINAAMKKTKFAGGRGDRPPPFREESKEGTQDCTPHPDASVGWKAAAVKNFMMSAEAIFRESCGDKLIETEAVWVCFKLHCEYFALLHLTSFEHADIVKLDGLIYRQQTLFLGIAHYTGLWKVKNHFATHFPVDILKFGPPLYWSEMKFEMKNQWFKKRARESNFIALLKTLAYETEMRASLDLFEGVFLAFLKSRME